MNLRMGIIAWTKISFLYDTEEKDAIFGSVSLKKLPERGRTITSDNVRDSLSNFLNRPTGDLLLAEHFTFNRFWALFWPREDPNKYLGDSWSSFCHLTAASYPMYTERRFESKVFPSPRPIILTKAREPSLLIVAGWGRTDGLIPFPKALLPSEVQTASKDIELDSQGSFSSTITPPVSLMIVVVVVVGR